MFAKNEKGKTNRDRGFAEARNVHKDVLMIDSQRAASGVEVFARRSASSLIRFSFFVFRYDSFVNPIS